MDELSDTSNITRKTRRPLRVHSWMSRLLPLRGRQKEIDHSFIYWAPTSCQAVCPKMVSTEVEEQLLVLRNLGSTGRGVLSHRTEPS